MSVRFQGLPALPITVNCVIAHGFRQPHTHNIHNNMINSPICSFSAALMLSGQSITRLMGMRTVTLCWCSFIRATCTIIRGAVLPCCCQSMSLIIASPYCRCLFFFETDKICHLSQTSSWKILASLQGNLFLLSCYQCCSGACVPQLEDWWYQLTQFPDCHCWQTL